MIIILTLSYDFDIVLQKNARNIFSTSKNVENEVLHFYLWQLLNNYISQY